MSKKIYTITTLRKITKERPTGQPRTVGFYYSLKAATAEVENNSCDIYEDGYYPYAVIEAFEPGIYMVSKEYWFTWDTNQNKYVKSEKPIELNNVCCFGMG